MMSKERTQSGWNAARNSQPPHSHIDLLNQLFPSNSVFRRKPNTAPWIELVPNFMSHLKTPTRVRPAVARMPAVSIWTCEL